MSARLTSLRPELPGAAISTPLRSWNVVPTGSKSKVLQHLRALQAEAVARKVYGLVDRDEWADTETVRRVADLPGLLVNPDRHCLESYFCVPADLKAALARSSVVNSDRVFRTIAQAVKIHLADWVAHWALWTTLERLKDSMSNAAYPNAFHQGLTLPATNVIKAKLREWAAMIDVDHILRTFHALRKMAIRETEDKQLCSHIYAKNVFPQIVLVELNKLNAGIDSNEWMGQMAGWFPAVPDDIRATLQTLVV